MNPDTIAKGIDYLALATATPMTDERVGIYINQLQDLKNEQLYADAIRVLANKSTFMPTVAEIRGAYRELLLRHRPGNALAAGEDASWHQHAHTLDDCLGTCNTRHPLGQLMQRNGYCEACATSREQQPERASWTGPRSIDAA